MRIMKMDIREVVMRYAFIILFRKRERNMTIKKERSGIKKYKVAAAADECMIEALHYICMSSSYYRFHSLH
jgi:hypothetical protein